MDEKPVNEKALWLAELVCSTQDLCGIAARGGFRDKERVQRRARAWFESDGDDVGPFVWTCDVLGLEAADRRRVLHFLKLSRLSIHRILADNSRTAGKKKRVFR